MGVGDNGKICIVGGGNGAITMAADLTLRGWEVALWDFPEFNSGTIAAIRENGGIELVGAREGFAALRQEQVPVHLEEAVTGASIVMLIVPAFGHAHAARLVAPHLSSDQIIVVGPSTGGALEVWSELQEAGVKDVPAAEMVSLIYTCRLRDKTTADLYYIKDSLAVGVQPSEFTEPVIRSLQELYPQVQAATNVLETSLNNINPVLHVAPMLLNLGRIESTGGDFYFYRESVTKSVGRVMDDMDEERLAITSRLGFKRFSLADFMSDMYQVRGENAEELLANSPAHRSTRAPHGLGHRYATEDVPYGLVPMLSIAALLGIDMPVTRLLVDLASLLSRRDFLIEGRSASKLGIDGLTTDDLRPLLEHGKRTAQRP